MRDFSRLAVVSNFSWLGLSVLAVTAMAAPAGAEASRWHPGFYLNGLSQITRVSIVFDDGSGPALYLGGDMLSADDVLVSYLARWDGSRMSAVGGGLNGPVSALAVFDDGGGPALYVGGEFTVAGGLPASFVAKWDGAVWSAVGAGGPAGFVYDLRVWDDGNGPALYAAGDFGDGGALTANGIAKWNGSTAFGSSAWACGVARWAPIR